MFERLANWVLYHRKLNAILLTAAFLSLGAGLTHLRFDWNIEGFFAEDGQYRAEFEIYQRQWGVDDRVVIIPITVDDGTILTRARLELLGEVEEAFLGHPEVAQITGLPDFVPIRTVDDTLELRSVLETMPQNGTPDSAPMRAWRQRLLKDPFLVPSLLSVDATTSAFLLELSEDTHDVTMITARMKWVRSILSTFEGRQGVHFSDAGILSVRSNFMDAIIKDQSLTLPIAFALMFLGLLVGFRRTHGVLIPMIAAVIPVLMTFGVMGYMGEPIDMINNTLMTLLPAIALADAIHLLNRYHEEARRITQSGAAFGKEERKQAILRALSELGKACFLTSLTTCVGFASLYLADMSVLKNFGLYAALGIVFSFCTVVLIVPLLLSITRGDPVPLSKPENSRLSAFFEWPARQAIENPYRVLLIALGVTLLFCYFSAQVEVKNSLTAALYKEHPTTIANDLVDKQLGGVLTYEVDIISDQPLLKDPAFLKALHDTETWTAAHPQIRSVLSPATFISQLSQSFRGTEEFPTDQNLIAQLYLMLEGNEGLEQIFTTDFKRARMIIRTQDEKSDRFVHFAERLRTRLDTIEQHHPVKMNITGVSTLGYRGVDNITKDMRRGLIGAFFIVAFIIALEFKSALITLLALIANGIPLIMGYGVLGAFGWALEPTGALIFTVGLGIAVDDTLHLLVRYFEEVSKGRSSDEAIRSAVEHCGRAVLITSSLLTFALGANLLSLFTTIRGVGMSGITIILAALLCDLFVLPALLKLTGPYLPRPQRPA